MSIDSVDLNLLRVLTALLDTGSVAAAADRLHLSAPAVSRSLARLRTALNDPLLVRAGRHLEPTPLAEQLREPARQALDAVAGVLTPPVPIEAAEIERRFTIRADDAIIAVMGLPLINHIREQAPGIDIKFLPAIGDLVANLRNGNTDLIVGVGNPEGGELHSQRLLTDHFVAATRTGHPLSSTDLTPATYAAAGHITVSPHGDGHGPIDHALEQHGLERRHVATVTSFVVAAHIVSTTDLVGTLPNALVRTFESTMPITSTSIPLELPQFHLGQTWHNRVDTDHAHRWLREQVEHTASTVSDLIFEHSRNRTN